MDEGNLKSLGNLVLESGTNLVKLTKDKIDDGISQLEVSIGLKPA